MERLTKPTIGCFKYGLSNFNHKPREFADYDAFYAYNMAVKRLGEYEDTGLTPEEIENLKDQSASDVAEVVHGEWIECDCCDPRDNWVKCNSCGYETTLSRNIKYGHCPNCGAKMDGGK